MAQKVLGRLCTSLSYTGRPTFHPLYVGLCSRRREYLCTFLRTLICSPPSLSAKSIRASSSASVCKALLISAKSAVIKTVWSPLSLFYWSSFSLFPSVMGILDLSSRYRSTHARSPFFQGRLDLSSRHSCLIIISLRYHTSCLAPASVY